MDIERKTGYDRLMLELDSLRWLDILAEDVETDSRSQMTCI